MASILNVDQINNAAGTSAVTIDSSGNVVIPGHVVQVVDATSTTNTVLSNPSSNVWYSVNPSVTISPKFANSKIVIQHYAGGLAQDTDSVGLRISRNGTVIYANDRHGYTASQNDWVPVNYSSVWTDTPATTSAVTYSFEISSSASSGIALRHNDYRNSVNTAFSIAMEIAQ